MIKKRVSLIFSLMFIVSLILYMWIGYLRSHANLKIERETPIFKKVYRVYKLPDEKTIRLVFGDNTEYHVPFFGLNDLIDPGDSLVKHGGTFNYVIYKAGTKDSIIYEGYSRFH